MVTKLKCGLRIGLIQFHLCHYKKEDIRQGTFPYWGKMVWRHLEQHHKPQVGDGESDAHVSPVVPTFAGKWLEARRSLGKVLSIMS